jgi:protein-disulfide isomerase
MPPVPRPGKKGQRRVDRTVVIAVGVAVVVAAALIVGSLALSGGDDDPGGQATGTTTVVDGIEQHGTVLGDPAATVTLLQYEDIQCPNCQSYMAGTFPELVDQYVRDGRVKIDLRGVAFLGDDSVQALRAVLAAAKQDKGWQLLDLLYQNQGEENSGWVTDVLIEDLASQIDGLDVDRMLTDADSEQVTAELDALAKEANERGVQGTPWFMVRQGDGAPQAVAPTPYDPALIAPALDAALQG